MPDVWQLLYLYNNMSYLYHQETQKRLHIFRECIVVISITRCLLCMLLYWYSKSYGITGGYYYIISPVSLLLVLGDQMWTKGLFTATVPDPLSSGASITLWSISTRWLQRLPWRWVMWLPMLRTMPLLPRSLINARQPTSKWAGPAWLISPVRGWAWAHKQRLYLCWPEWSPASTQCLPLCAVDTASLLLLWAAAGGKKTFLILIQLVFFFWGTSPAVISENDQVYILFYILFYFFSDASMKHYLGNILLHVYSFIHRSALKGTYEVRTFDWQGTTFLKNSLCERRKVARLL